MNGPSHVSTSALRNKLSSGLTAVCGIVNITPDSFVINSRVQTAADILQRMNQMVADGAAMLDVGAVSTRPDAGTVSVHEELQRLEPVWSLLSALDRPWSIDTFRADVAQKAIASGASMVNDVTGGHGDPNMLAVVAETGIDWVLTHSRAVGSEMRDHQVYDDFASDILNELDQSIEAALSKGVAEHQIWIDPGIGFCKTAQQSLWAMSHIEMFRRWGFPLYVGASRKSFLGEITGRSIDQRMAASLATVAWCARHNIEMVRVHDVAESVDTVRVWRALEGAA